MVFKSASQGLLFWLSHISGFESFGWFAAIFQMGFVTVLRFGYLWLSAVAFTQHKNLHFRPWMVQWQHLEAWCTLGCLQWEDSIRFTWGGPSWHQRSPNRLDQKSTNKSEVPRLLCRAGEFWWLLCALWQLCLGTIHLWLCVVPYDRWFSLIFYGQDGNYAKCEG